jgi:hypothetical protein
MIMIKNKFTLLIPIFLVSVFFFVTLPEKSYSGFSTDLGCCLDINQNCLGCGSLECAISGPECAAIGGDNHVRRSECLSDNQCREVNPEALGCCVISQGTCIDEEAFRQCSPGFIDSDGEGIAWFQGVDCSEVPQCDPITRDVPTLSKLGLVALAVVIGITGYMIIRRRKVTA